MKSCAPCIWISSPKMKQIKPKQPWPLECKKLLDQFQNVSSFPGGLGLNHSWPWLCTMLCLYIYTNSQLCLRLPLPLLRFHNICKRWTGFRGARWLRQAASCASWQSANSQEKFDVIYINREWKTTTNDLRISMTINSKAALCIQTNHTQARSDSDCA